jgi:HemY protein
VRTYRALLVLLGLALLAALAAWTIGTDPGYVLVQRGGWALETSLVFALVALGALIALVALVTWLLRWPLRAMTERARRRGRIRFARGALALIEGRHARAETLLIASSRLRSVRVPALIGAYYAARGRGDARRQGELLANLGADEDGVVAAAVLRAEAELAEGRAGTAIELLTPLEQGQRLPPAGVRALIAALAARGRARECGPLLARMRRSPALPPAELDAFEGSVVARALTDATSVVNFDACWNELSRAQRRLPGVAEAYARRAAVLGVGDPAAREVEAVLKKQWSDDAVLAWSALQTPDGAVRLRTAEGWLRERPTSGGLLVALGRLCRDQSLWGKAEEYLRRALGGAHAAQAWEELGHVWAAQGDAARASRAYANALAATRREPPQAVEGLATRGELLEAPIAVEERSEHGVPRLPEASRG